MAWMNLIDTQSPIRLLWLKLIYLRLIVHLWETLLSKSLLYVRTRVKLCRSTFLLFTFTATHGSYFYYLSVIVACFVFRLFCCERCSVLGPGESSGRTLLLTRANDWAFVRLRMVISAGLRSHWQRSDSQCYQPLLSSDLFRTSPASRIKEQQVTTVDVGLHLL